MRFPATVFTIGHSTRKAEDFVSVLKLHDIELVADVRRFPGSRRHPHFESAALARTLSKDGIEYTWFSSLGGRRRGATCAEHAGWRNSSFRAYAAYTWSEEFAQGLHELLHVCAAKRTALMCSELLWWRCHRALIADVLRFLEVEVIHLSGPGAGKLHPYTSPARVVEGQLIYPAEGCC